MWDLVTRLLWLPFDIMQRVSQRFILLGRNIYGSLFGGQPSIKPPPPKSPPPNPPSRSCSSTSITKAGWSLPENIIKPDMSAHSVKESLGMTSSSASGDIDVEQGRILGTSCNTWMNEATTFQMHSDSHSLSGMNVSRKNDEDSSQKSDTPTATFVVAAEVVNETIASYLVTNNESANSKRSRDKEKRKAARKDSKKKVGDGEAPSEAVSRSQSKKQKLSEEVAAKEVPSDSCQDTEHDKRKRKRRKTNRKNKSEKEQGQTQQEKEVGGGSEKMGKYIPPNFFIAIQISNQNILGNVAQLQKSFAEKTLSPPWHGLTSTEIFQDAMIPVQKLHFTLHVMNLQGSEEMEKARSALEECYNEVYREFLDDPMDMTIEGLGHFRNSVIFAQIKEERVISRLGKLSELLREKFEAVNIAGDPRPFKPHMTIAKISRSNKLHKKRIRSFPPDIWSGCEQTNFGIQRVDSIQLLYMAGEDRLTGYYRCFAEYNFTDKSSTLSATNDSLNKIDNLSLQTVEPSVKNTTSNLSSISSKGIVDENISKEEENADVISEKEKISS